MSGRFGKTILLVGAVGAGAYYFYDQQQRRQQAELLHRNQFPSAQDLGKRIDDSASSAKGFVEKHYQDGVDAAKAQRKSFSEQVEKAQKESENKLNEWSKAAKDQQNKLNKDATKAVDQAADASKSWIDSARDWVTGKK